MTLKINELKISPFMGFHSLWLWNADRESNPCFLAGAVLSFHFILEKAASNLQVKQMCSIHFQLPVYKPDPS